MTKLFTLFVPLELSIKEVLNKIHVKIKKGKTYGMGFKDGDEVWITTKGKERVPGVVMNVHPNHLVDDPDRILVTHLTVNGHLSESLIDVYSLIRISDKDKK